MLATLFYLSDEPCDNYNNNNNYNSNNNNNNNNSIHTKLNANNA